MPTGWPIVRDDRLVRAERARPHPVVVDQHADEVEVDGVEALGHPTVGVAVLEHRAHGFRGRFLGNLELRRRHDLDDLDDVGERSVRRDALVLVAGLAVRQVGRDVDLQLVARLRPE